MSVEPLKPRLVFYDSHGEVWGIEPSIADEHGKISWHPILCITPPKNVSEKGRLELDSLLTSLGCSRVENVYRVTLVKS